MTSLAGLAASIVLAGVVVTPDQAEPSADPVGGSVIIATADRLRVVGLPWTGPDDVCFCETYEAEFEVLRTLDGPPVRRRVAIRFISHAMRERQPNFVVLMAVTPTSEGLWAGDSWRGVTRDTCLVHDERGWWEAEPDAQGRRPDCTPVSTLVRPNRL